MFKFKPHQYLIENDVMAACSLVVASSVSSRFSIKLLPLFLFIAI